MANDDRIATFNVDELARWICSEFDVGFGTDKYRAIADVADALRDAAPRWDDEPELEPEPQPAAHANLESRVRNLETELKVKTDWLTDATRERADENMVRIDLLEERVKRIVARLEARKPTIAQVLERLQALENLTSTA